MFVYHIVFKYDVFRQCQWDASSGARREFSKALRDFRRTDVEIWLFRFRNAPAPVTALIVM